MEEKYTRTAERLKAIAEPTRLKILEMVTSEEMCVCEIIDKLHLSQPAISHHLKILRQAEIIKDRKEGKWTFYSLNKDSYKALLASIQLDYLIDNPIEEKHEPKICCKLESENE